MIDTDRQVIPESQVNTERQFIGQEMTPETLVENTNRELTISLEEESGKLLDFEKAKEHFRGLEFTFGKDQGFSFEQATNLLFNSQQKWGFLNSLQREGKISSPAEYRQMMQSTPISEQAILAVKALLKQGKKVMPIFDLGNLALAEAYQCLLKRSGITCVESQELESVIGKLRYFDKKQFFHFLTHSQPRYLQSTSNQKKVYQEIIEVLEYEKELFQHYYKNCQDVSEVAPRWYFVEDEMEVRNEHESAIALFEDAVYCNKKIVPPAVDFVRLRMQLDTYLQLLLGKTEFEQLNETEYRKLLGAIPHSNFARELFPDYQKSFFYPQYFVADSLVPPTTLAFGFNQRTQLNLKTINFGSNFSGYGCRYIVE